MSKRFYSEDNCKGYYTEIIDNEKELDLFLPNPKKNLTIEEAVDLLNEQHKTIQRLQGENAHYKLLLMSLKKEAEQLSKIR